MSASMTWQNSLIENGAPCDVAAERAILGAAQLNNSLMGEITSLLDEGDFRLEDHRLILRSMVSLSNQGMEISGITIAADLKARGELERIGGITYLASLIDYATSLSSIASLARIVKRKAIEHQTMSRLEYSLARLADGDHLEEVLEDLEQHCVQVRAREQSRSNGFYESLQELLDAELEEPEEIIYGLHRGEVGEIAAVSNFGKSTLLLNLCLSLAGGEMCAPLLPFVSVPRKVVYVDAESPASRLRSDLQVMIRQISSRQSVIKNFKPVVDAEIEGYPLNLSRRAHLKRLISISRKHKADLVVIDTVSSAFELGNENDNAEVARIVMNPLKALAREVGCAVIFAHHIGKANETQNAEGTYRGRGGSAFGALSRTVFTLEKDAKHGAGYIVLNCAKSKGVMFEPVLMKLNQEARWFELCGDRPVARPLPPTAQEVADFIAERGEATTDELKSHFAERGSPRTISDRIKEAERVGLIFKPHQKAPWRLCNAKNDDFEPVLQVAENATDSPFVQCATPIGIAQMHKPGANGQNEFIYCECGSSGLRFTHCDRCGDFLR